MTKELICTVCPNGCAVRVTCEGGQIIATEGASCERGRAFAASECLHPVRVLTTSVLVEGGRDPLVSVRSSVPIAKEAIAECVKLLRATRLRAPVSIYQRVACDVLGTGADIVATTDVECVKNA